MRQAADGTKSRSYKIVSSTFKLRQYPLPCRILAPSYGHPASIITSASSIAHSEGCCVAPRMSPRSEEHTSELQSLMRISYAVFCLKKKNKKKYTTTTNTSKTN